MTFGELKAFIEGMAVDKRPTEEQWSRLMAKLEQVESDQIMDLLSGQQAIPSGYRPGSGYTPLGNLYSTSVSNLAPPDVTVVKAGV